MATYDLYGTLSDDIERARNLLEYCLGVKFDIRDSDYHGGEYFQWGKASEEHFLLKKNIDSIDGEPVEISFPRHQILLYVNDTDRAADLHKCMSELAMSFTLLRHEEFE